MMLVATSMRAMQKSASSDRARRDWAMPRRRISVGLLEIDEDRGGGEKGDHHRDEIDEVAQGDGAEMAEDAGAGDRGDEPVGGPALEQAEHRRGPGDGQDENDGSSHDEGDDLVLGHG